MATSSASSLAGNASSVHLDALLALSVEFESSDEDDGNDTYVHPLSAKFKEDNESLDNHEFECNNDGSEEMSPLDEEQIVSPPLPSPLVRYKSLRDHNGRFCLVVKIA